MKYKKIYTSDGNVQAYKSESGYLIKGNGGHHIFTGRWIPADFWYISKDGKDITCFQYLKDAKAYVEKVSAEELEKQQHEQTELEQVKANSYKKLCTIFPEETAKAVVSSYVKVSCYFRGKPSRVLTTATDPSGKQIEIFL